jgi:type III pantothenate kinase
MLLAVDIGNTKIAIGVHREGEWAADWRITTHLDHLADEYAMLLKALLADAGLAFADISGTVIASVVPPMTAVFQELAERYTGRPALVLGPGVETGVVIRIDNPAETGADRVANTAAAHNLYGGPAIVIDLGTATTFDVVSEKGEYLGGAIAFGLGIAAEALVRRTARLPKVDLVSPPRAIGRNTVAAMQSGLVLGYVGLVKELVGCLKAEMNGDPKVIGTGGMAELVAEWTHVIDVVNPRLTLEGLRIIYQLNRRAAAPPAG